MELIDANLANVDQYSICGYKDKKNIGYQKKLDWIKDEFQHGLRYKFLVNGSGQSVGAIEYMPGEKNWRPIFADGYLVIHCIYIMKKEAKGKGYGKLMIQECINDAQANRFKGVAAVVRKGTWMVGKEIFESMGFEKADATPPDFELMALRFNSKEALPEFNTNNFDFKSEFSQGLSIISTDQCPYAVKAVKDITDTAINEFNIKPRVVHITENNIARWIPCGFGVFCILNEGKVIADHPISATRFKNIMRKELGVK